MLENLIELFGVFLVLILLVAFSVAITNGLPASSAKTTANNIQTGAFNVIDLSLIVFVFIVLFIDLILSWMHPNKLMAFVNLFGIFTLGILNYTLLLPIAPLANALNTNTLLPTTTSFVLGDTKVFIFLFVMVLSVIFNLRSGRI